MSKADDIFDALRDPSWTNFALAEGTLAGEKVHYVVAEAEKEKDDKVVALILDKKTIALLEELAAADGPDEDEDDEDFEEDEEDDDDEEDDEDEERDEEPIRVSRPRGSSRAPEDGGKRFKA